MGAVVGNIIATIMITQITRNRGARGPMVTEAVVISMVASACRQTRPVQAAAASAKSKPNTTLR